MVERRNNRRPADESARATPPQGTAWRAQIVSAPFGSGLSWLVNVLLELDVRVTHFGFQQDHWLDTENGEECGAEAWAHLRWHLPVLLERRCFRFPEALEVLFEHRLSFARSPARRTILFVRDPRDAIHSFYQREYARHLSLTQYLDRSDTWPDHFPGLFGLPPAETWALFLLFWLAIAEIAPVHVVRFEQMRADPLGQTRACLEFLGLERDDSAIERALTASTFERALAAMQHLESQTGEVRRTARAGRVGEWSEVYSSDELTRFRGLPEAAMLGLGYPGLPEQTPRTPRRICKQGELLERLLPETRRGMQIARRRFNEGDAVGADALLRTTAEYARRHAASRLACAGMLVALRWTESVFTQARRKSEAARLIFDHWTRLCHTLAPSPCMQRVLFGAIDTPDPDSQETAFRPLEGDIATFSTTAPTATASPNAVTSEPTPEGSPA